MKSWFDNCFIQANQPRNTRLGFS